MTRCLQEFDFGDSWLTCDLPMGHDGPHHDAGYRMKWEPDE